MSELDKQNKIDMITNNYLLKGDIKHYINGFLVIIFGGLYGFKFSNSFLTALLFGIGLGIILTHLPSNYTKFVIPAFIILSLGGYYLLLDIDKAAHSGESFSEALKQELIREVLDNIKN